LQLPKNNFMKLSIVIPVYNEKNTILQILEKVERVSLLSDLEKEVIIVDDFSADGSREILKSLDKKYRIIFHNKNKGKGAALKSGFKAASGDIILIQDADLEYNPEEYPLLLEPILNKKAKVVYGSRFFKKHNPRYRLFYFGNKFLSFLFSIFYGKWISDMETCYKVFRREVLDNIKIKSDRFDFEPEITAKIIKAGYDIKEVPISYESRSIEEGKKIGWKDGFSAIYTIIKYRFIN